MDRHATPCAACDDGSDYFINGNGIISPIGAVDKCDFAALIIFSPDHHLQQSICKM